MTTFSRVTIALIGMTGLAAAQPKDPKAGAMAGDAKAGAMPELKPPQELLGMAKGGAGTWRCKGQGMDHASKMIDMTGTMTLKLDVHNWWIRASFESKLGKEPFSFESFTTYDAATKKWKRVMVETGGSWSHGESDGLKDNKVDWNLTSHAPGAMAAMMGGATEFMFRDHEDLSEPKAGVKMWGEFSPDKGKSWVKVYEMACKK